MSVHETRSPNGAGRGRRQRDCESLSSPEGVGARQGDLFAPGGGGGYLDECTPPKIREGAKLLEAAKIRELSTMGLPAIWIRVAETIGYDSFLQFWRILDTAAELREIRRSDNESMIEVTLRRYSSFARFQRNRYIETMSARGMHTARIQQVIEKELGEKLDRSHIRRLAKAGRMVE